MDGLAAFDLKSRGREIAKARLISCGAYLQDLGAMSLSASLVAAKAIRRKHF